MNILKTSSVLCAAIGLALANPVFAAEKQAKGESSSSVTAMDKAWAHVAAVSDKMELQLAKAAESKGQSPEVKQHAQQMMQDHTKTSDQLKEWAKSNKVDLKAELPPQKKAVVDEITSKSGAEFDRAYMDHEIAHHRMAAAHFQNGTQFLMNPELKQFAQANQPVINQHLSMVEKGGHSGHGGSQNAAGGAGSSGSGAAGGQQSGQKQDASGTVRAQ